ncbi:MAG: cobalamin B12-binding domain-containing protein, partial [Saccharofermentanales bacterium]
FNDALSRHDKPECVRIAMGILDTPQPDVVSLYEEVLRPSLTSIAANDKKQEIPVWDEHIRSSIVRSVIELCYPPVLKSAQERTGLKAAIFCTEDETHEIGARMVTDYLTLLGFDSVFIGASTPTDAILDAISHLQPDLVAVSVTNYYHLVALSALISKIRALTTLKTKIVVGGYAISTLKNPECFDVDYISHGFDDLAKIREELL